MYKYERKVEYAGGVNVPKIIFCIGSDGRRYKQLCKVSNEFYYWFSEHECLNRSCLLSVYDIAKLY